MARRPGTAGVLVLLLGAIVIAVVCGAGAYLSWVRMADLSAAIETNQQAFDDYVMKTGAGLASGRFSWDVKQQIDNSNTGFRFGPDSYRELQKYVKWAFAGRAIQERVLGSGNQQDVDIYHEQAVADAVAKGFLPQDDVATTQTVRELVEKLQARCGSLQAELEHAKVEMEKALTQSAEAAAARAKAIEDAKKQVEAARAEADNMVGEARKQAEGFKQQFTEMEAAKSKLAAELLAEEQKRRDEVAELQKAISGLKDEIALLRKPPEEKKEFVTLGSVQQVSLSDSLIFVGGGKDVGMEAGQRLVVFTETPGGGREWKAELKVTKVLDVISQVIITKKGASLLPVMEGDKYVKGETWDEFAPAAPESEKATEKVAAKTPASAPATVPAPEPAATEPAPEQ
ncbi:MAG TPA: hypothetical protein PL033_06300 [Candidatus Brocadiia bacterium]|nr:hypothetical protein [Candidatus Brocadiia bacterium]